jgi:hypothetical protein
MFSISTKSFLISISFFPVNATSSAYANIFNCSSPIFIPLGTRSSCKYLGIIFQSDLNWVDQVNYTAQKAWKGHRFVMRVFKEGNRNTKRLVYTSLVHPILEYGSACWDPCREGQINVLEQVQKKAAQFTNHTKDSDRETLAQHRTIARLCALFKAYSGERAWKAIRNK